MAGHEDEQLVSLAISRLLSTLDDLEPGASLPRELLVSLHCVLGGSLLPSALRLVDKGAVKMLIGRGSGKKVVQVEGDSGLFYYLFPSSHYCPCPAYQHGVLGRGELACKHLLAASLATGLKIHQEERVEEDKLLAAVETIS